MTIPQGLPKHVVQSGGFSQLVTFRERALEARDAAEFTNLPNVRERWLSAAAAWDAMADRIQNVQDFRRPSEPKGPGPEIS